MDQETILNEFTDWCDKNIIAIEGNKRIGIKQFNDLVNNANSELKRLTAGRVDETSFACGIAAGIRLMTIPTKEY